MITMSFALGGYKDCLFSSCFTFIYIYIDIYIWGGLPFLTHSSSERLKYVFHPPSQPFALMEIHTLDHPALLKTVFPHTLALTTKQQHIVWQWEKWPFKDWRGDLQLGIFQGHELNHVTVEVISMTSTSLWSCVLDIQMPKVAFGSKRDMLPSCLALSRLLSLEIWLFPPKWLQGPLRFKGLLVYSWFQHGSHM